MSMPTPAFVRDGLLATQFFDDADDENAPCLDLVLLDMNLPKKGGEPVLKHLTQQCEMSGRESLDRIILRRGARSSGHCGIRCRRLFQEANEL